MLCRAEPCTSARRGHICEQFHIFFSTGPPDPPCFVGGREKKGIRGRIREREMTGKKEGRIGRGREGQWKEAENGGKD